MATPALKLGLRLCGRRSSSGLLVLRTFLGLCIWVLSWSRVIQFPWLIMVLINGIGEKGRRIRELTSVVQKRFKFPENSVELYAEKVNNRGLCAIAQAESLRYKLLGGLAVRRACYGVLRFVMESGAKGCEVIVSGKLRAQRAKSMKFKDGYMISSGQPVKEYIDSAVRHVLLRQGVLGIKVKIMLDWDPKGKQGPTTPLPDLVTIHPPKDEEEYEFERPSSFVATEIPVEVVDA
ncbi:small ribosomal subunit protein uS3y-like isoform X2 [Humulus lupulus]|uniref:small ribosomal subunit protein uS3y-like isoform X2 n=1 Tax=Humulus lupulus TaxID=3486 RepID=UPI002B408594|nr:small ribosomal subunit protein uS3y-like isoform X2 [Humulus lupulus]